MAAKLLEKRFGIKDVSGDVMTPIGKVLGGDD